MDVFPHIKQFEVSKNLTWNGKIKTYNVEDFDAEGVSNLLMISPFKEYHLVKDENPDVIFKKDDALKDSTYQIEIKETSFVIRACNLKGVFYALQTLIQLVNQDNLQVGLITDYPDLDMRGVMLDISRSKVPTLKTLEELVDLFAMLKINHLELYVEGFSYEYPSFKEEIKDGNYLPLKDYLALEKYCNERFIDLVPNQNSLGHMTDWLATDKYKHLAECPNGFYIWGSERPPSTLWVTNKESLDFVKKLYDDMLPYFKSNYFNMNLDEPLELGNADGKSMTELNGKTPVEIYIDFANNLANYVKGYKKTPLMWGDVLVKHPETLPLLDKDIIFIDWGYSKNYDFIKNTQFLKENNIKFYLAPGTGSWATVLGKYPDMIGSINHAKEALTLNNGSGMLLTDWGDTGHLQYLPVSYPAFIYGGCKAWGNIDENELVKATNTFLKDDVLTNSLISLSKYTSLEGPYRDYGGKLFACIMWAEHAMRYPDKCSFYNERMKTNYLSNDEANSLNVFFEDEKKKVSLVKDTLIKEELLNSIYLLETLIKINVKLRDKTYDFIDEVKALENYRDVHHRLWIARNIENGYKFSVKRIDNLILVLHELHGKEQL